MAKRGAENYQTTEVVPFGGDRRLRPPDHLSADARDVFVALVGSLPSGHFKVGDLPLIARWCELTALCERAARELDQRVVEPDNKLSPWFSVLVQSTKALNALAARLKIGPSARAPKVSKKTPAPMSVYDEMRMQKNWDKVP
jgi:phage terminase small subunit